MAAWVSVPESVYDLLRIGAATRRLSIRRYAERLVSKWIKGPRTLNTDPDDLACQRFTLRLPLDLSPETRKALGLHAAAIELNGSIRTPGVWIRCVLRQECPTRNELLEDE